MQQLSAALHSRELTSLSRVLKALGSIVCVVLTPFRLSQISCCTLQQPQVFPWSEAASVPPPTECRSCSLSFSFSLSTFILPSFAWIYIFLSSGQGLLPNLSCCSAMSSASEDVFLMHPQREIYSMSNYSSAILSPAPPTPTPPPNPLLLLFYCYFFSLNICY